MKSVYADIESTINEKVTQYSFTGRIAVKTRIPDALSDAFEVTSSDMFNDLRCTQLSMSRLSEAHDFCK